MIGSQVASFIHSVVPLCVQPECFMLIIIFCAFELHTNQNHALYVVLDN